MVFSVVSIDSGSVMRQNIMPKGCDGAGLLTLDKKS